MTQANPHTALSALADQARHHQRVPSPCISVCRMDTASGLCEGCFRTIDEIVSWASLGETARRSVWRLVERRAGLEPVHAIPAAQSSRP